MAKAKAQRDERQVRGLVPSRNIRYRQVERVLDKYRAEILAKPGVKSVGIGLKYKGEHTLESLAIIVAVEEKVSPDELDTDEMVLPTYEGVPTDVISPRVELCAGPAGGDRIQAAGSNLFGTVALDVFSKPGDTIRLLTAAHVVNPSSTPGATGSVTDGTGSVIGTVHSEVLDDELDAALIEFTTPRLFREGMRAGLPDPPAIQTVRPELIGQTVWTFGARTGRQMFGRIVSIDWPDMPLNNPQVPILRNQIGIRPDSGSHPFAPEGDSGAVVINALNGLAIGIVRALDKATNTSICCHLDKVAAALDFDIL